ncbi:YajG family lipoprotein [Pseudoalteromonas sp. T1lg65]|uniref:YajG family lipoprotein n=1 Tax=Pseudoalteromonas sp. T1lg65 TaxID=2077101 RepID=UPI003F78FC01
MKHTFITLIVLLLISACATPPKQVIFSPNYEQSSNALSSVILFVEVQDRRKSKFTIKVKDQEPALYLPDAHLPVKMQNLVETAIQANSGNISNSAISKLTLQIQQFRSEVSESFTKHESQAVAHFNVNVQQPSRTFEKSYSATASLTGPLKHEQAKVEAQLNELATKLVNRIIQDPELIEFVRGS